MKHLVWLALGPLLAACGSDVDVKKGPTSIPDAGPADSGPAPTTVVLGGATLQPDGVVVPPFVDEPGGARSSEWRTYAGSGFRHFFNPNETVINASNVSQLAIKWEFAGPQAIITGSPTVADVDLPEGRTKVVYTQSWDQMIWAVRLSDGTEVWRFKTPTSYGPTYPNASSPHFETIDGQPRLFISSGQVMFSLNAATGEEVWRFYAGTGCVDDASCAANSERNEILSSGIIADGKIFFGMDVNDSDSGRGGFFAVNAISGKLEWFFDLSSGSTCYPNPGDDVDHFDGYHSEAQLGLPADFFATRKGCNGWTHAPNNCGNVYSSGAVDLDRKTVYFGGANCSVGGSAVRPPTLPPHDEALSALRFDGTPVWSWRPHPDSAHRLNQDLGFGAVPNLFSIEVGGKKIDVVGSGNKDGTYYVIDRDGINEVSGVRFDDPVPGNLDLPYWKTSVTPGGAADGIGATSSVDVAAGRVYFGTGSGSPFNPQRPTMHAVDINTGNIVWQNTGEFDAAASFSPASGIPGVVFMGTVGVARLRAYDTTTGQMLMPGNGILLGGLGGTASAPAVVDGTLVMGSGIGGMVGDPQDPQESIARRPTSLMAFCVPGTLGCTATAP